MIIRPQAGPQEMFLSCNADFAIYGGAAGGGKSYALLMEGARNIHVPGYGGVIFRINFGDITNQGGLWDTSEEIYPYIGGVPRKSSMEWRWKSGASISFSHFQHEKNKYNWQGSQIPFIGWDELTHFSQEIFWYMFSRNRSTCGVKPYIRATTNPDPDSWVLPFIQWWIDDSGYARPERGGVIRWFARRKGEIIWGDSKEELVAKGLKPRSFTFIPSSVYDNKILMDADPDYESNLNALMEHERARLLDGNWLARAQPGSYFKTHWFKILDAVPEGEEEVRYWDRASTEVHETNSDPDWTVGVKMRRVNGEFFVVDVKRERLTPGGVVNLIMNTASQEPDCPIVLEQDPGQAGVSDIFHLMQCLAGYNVIPNPVTKAKEVRAKPVSSQSQAGNVKLMRGRWNDQFLRELEGFPPEKDKGHDDQVDAFSGAFNYLTRVTQPRVRST